MIGGSNLKGYKLMNKEKMLFHRLLERYTMGKMCDFTEMVLLFL